MSAQEPWSDNVAILAREVATVLGKGWQYLGPGHGIYEWGKELLGNKHYKITLETVYSPNECLELRAIAPDKMLKYVGLPGHSEPIRLATRRPQRIAAEIVHRLLPKYRKLCSRARAIKTISDAYREKQEANLQILARALGIKLTDRTRWVGGMEDSRGRFFADNISVRTEHKTASITLDSISISKAKTILRFLRKRERRKRVPRSNTTQMISVFDEGRASRREK